MRLALIFSCLVLGACGLFPSADHASIGGQSGFIPLNNAEIESTLNGHYLEYDQGSNAIGPRVRREHYCAGLMRTTGDRVPIVATPYTIADGQICFESTRRSCRSMHRDQAGNLYMQWRGDDNAITAPLRIDLGAAPAGSCTR